MSKVNDAYINALLADATYALDETVLDGISNEALTDVLKTRMTPVLAKYIGDNFTVVTHIETDDTFGSGFDATVWRDKSGKTYVSMQGTTGLGDLLTDIDLAVEGAAKSQIVDMVNWWIKNTTAAGQSAAQVALIDGFLVSASDIPGTGLLDGLTNIEVNGHSLGGHLSTAFTRLFGGTQGYINHTYSYNSGGFNSNSDIFFEALEQLLSEGGFSGGAGAFPGVNGQSNFFAENGINITTNDWFNGQQGQRIPLFNEEGTGLPNHYMYKLTDALALANVLAGLDHSFDIPKMTDIFDSGSNQAETSLETILDMLGGIILGSTYSATPVGDVGESAESRVTYHEQIALLRQALFSNPDELAPVSKPEYQNLKIVEVNSLSSSAALSSEDGYAYRYALIHLMPFAITGNSSLYTHHNINGEIEYEAHSESFWEDRAEFLEKLEQRNLGDIGNNSINSGIDYASVVGAGTHYYEVHQENGDTYSILGEDIDLAGAHQVVNQVIFGSNNSESDPSILTGGNKDDRIYGMAGDDVLTGDRGNDKLYGGKGNDTYIYDENINQGHDVISDVQGNNRLQIGGQTISTIKQIAPSSDVYQDSSGNSYVYTSSNQTLIITLAGGRSGTITIENFDFSMNNFGLTIDGADVIEAPVLPTGLYEVGTGYFDDPNEDPDPFVYNNYHQRETYQSVLNEQGLTVDLSLITSLWDYNAAYDEVRNESFSPLYNHIGEEGYLQLYFDGTTFDDVLTGGGQGESLDGFLGDDIMYGHGGFDILVGGYGADSIYGGDQGDWIFGDGNNLYEDNGTAIESENGKEIEHGDDVLFGEMGEDLISGEYGQDYIDGGDGEDQIFGGGGDDQLSGGNDADEIWGDSRIETSDSGFLSNDFKHAPTEGFSYNDILHGGEGDDILVGEIGHDILLGGGGNDKLHGDRTSLTGDAEDDLSGVYHGDDVLDGGAGDDSAKGGGGDDVVLGGDGADSLWGDHKELDGQYHGSDLLKGGEGNDQLIGGGADDTLWGARVKIYLWAMKLDITMAPLAY